MALLVYLLLLSALIGRSSALYCICKDGVSDQLLQKSIDYACGQGADCTPILQNGVCYNPNTVKDHCNYAVNSYFQRKGQAQGSCDFSGTATTSQTAPASSSSTCVYPSSPSNTGTPSTTPTTGTPGTSPSTTTSPSATPGTSTGTGTGTTGTVTGSPNVFGISPSSTTPTGFNNDSAAGMVLVEGTKLLIPLVLLPLWLCFFRV